MHFSKYIIKKKCFFFFKIGGVQSGQPVQHHIINQQILQRTPPQQLQQQQTQSNSPQQQQQQLQQQMQQQQQQPQQIQQNNQQTFPIQNQQILIQSPQQSQGQITQQFIIQQSPGQANLNQSSQQQRLQYLHNLQQQQQINLVPAQDQNQILTTSPIQNQVGVQKVISAQPSPQNAGTNQQIIAHPISLSPSQSGPPQQTIMQNQSMQKIHIQSQVVIAGQPIQGQSPQHQWSPKSPIQPSSQQQQQQSPQVAAQGPPTFIRAARPQWVQGQPAPQRQLIHLDAQTHAQLQTMEPSQRAEYLAKLQKRNMIFRQQVAFQARPGIVGGQRPTGTQHIIVRGQVPAGLTQQQQMQWLQQQRPILVRSAAPGLSPISVPGGVTQLQAQFPVDSAQGQFQRMQVPQAAQKPIQSGVPASPKQFPDNAEIPNIILHQQTGIVQQVVTPDGNSPMNKTKTALANMLSSRLNSNGGNMTPVSDTSTEPSAAGTLRLMTAQHNAALNQTVVERSSQELLVLQQQQRLQSQQRQTLGNITNNVSVGLPISPIQGQLIAQIPLSPSHVALKGGPFSPTRPPLPRPQFYGHNPNLKLPLELFLLGCIFYIVEYDESHEKSLPQWKELIEKHGGEIETFYCPRVTHVLCRTQRHGVVMQAIRDSKRCVTAYWLNDTMIRKQVLPPNQALHLPMPSTFGTQRPATKYIISTSGFEGDERIRIKQMVEESGAMFTAYLSRHNSVLVCKKPEGRKYKRAKDWNIPVVNTIWLSDILQGNLSQMSQYDSSKYQQYNLNGPFRIDCVLVTHLMSKFLYYS